MLKLITFTLLAALSLPTFSMTCSEKLQEQKQKYTYFEKLGRNAQNGMLLASGVGGLYIATAVATAALPAYGIGLVLFSTPFTIGLAIKGIHNRPYNRMIKLIGQADKLVLDIDSKPGRLLRKVHKKILNHKSGNNISILDLAHSISEANQDESMCGSLNRLNKIDENIQSGKLPVIQIDVDGEEV